MALKISPLTLGLLGLLAYRTYNGQGRLADMLGRGAATPPEPGSAGASNTAQQGGGGLGDLLGSLLGGGAAGGRPAGAPGTQQPGLGGLLGGLLAGGVGGGLLSGGLGSLLEQFQQQGQGGTVNSWIGKGENQPIAPDDLERAVGKDALDELARHSGKSYDQVVAELSSNLPDTVDQFTPDGRIPSPEEADRIAG